MRGVSLECVLCGEFVLRSAGTVCCPECGFRLRDEGVETDGMQLARRAG
jgi:uncharacterized Zn finger protein (UPF0148 family)